MRTKNAGNYLMINLGRFIKEISKEDQKELLRNIDIIREVVEARAKLEEELREEFLEVLCEEVVEPLVITYEFNEKYDDLEEENDGIGLALLLLESFLEEGND